jgi:hypothetical protein
MKPPPPVECPPEHEVITRLVLQIGRGVCGKYFPGKPLYHQLDLVFLLLYVLVGHCDRRPMTVSKLSRAFGLSRASTLRRLKELIASGYVQRIDRDYWLTEKSNSLGVRNAVAKNVAGVIAAAEKLAAIKSGQNERLASPH